MAYGYEDLNTQASPVAAIDRAARDLLCSLDGSKSAISNSSYNDLRATESLGALNPALPVLFICRGFASLVVKKVYRLNVVYAQSFG